MGIYKKIFKLLNSQERRQAYLLLSMIFFMAFLDTLGVVSIMPFMAVLGNPKVVETNRWLSMAFNILGLTDPKDLLFFLGIIVFIFLVLSIIFKALTQWAMLRFANMRNHSLSCHLLKGYLERPYAWFLSQHSSNLGKNILSEIYIVVHEVIIPFLQLIAHGTIAFFLIILLFLIDPLLSLVAVLYLGGSYALIYGAIRHYLSWIGKDRLAANTERFKIAQEALAGIKEVKIFGREKIFYNRFICPSFRFAKRVADSLIIGLLPRYILEILAFGGILLVTLYLFKSYGEFSKILPTLAVYAFAGYKILPALQQVYQSMTKLRFGLPTLDRLHKDVMELRDDEQMINNHMSKALIPNKLIALKDIHFTYPDAQTPTITGLDLHIPVNKTIGLVGATGSCKTTIVDLILGLLWPDKGTLLVDDTIITKDNVRSWQKSLGYVAQQIYLTDDSIAANIAFGIPPDDIDMEALIRAAKAAELHEFVTKDQDKGYDTLVGERGVRLSGGQRQRISIARALYRCPKVLVLDEATSSLDNITEKHIMQAIMSIKGEMTVIIIAHRLSTVYDCDIIYFLDHGQIKAYGTYNELLKNSEDFRKLAEIEEDNFEA
jgi:ATP-binding cassette, subfamily B, bacterial PglK